MPHPNRLASLILSYFLVLPLNAVSPNSSPKEVRGVVSHRISGCDYFVVATKADYDVLEWFGGHDPDKGDVLIGNYESYGFHSIHDETTDQSLRVWTEDYSLTKEDAIEKLGEKCE